MPRRCITPSNGMASRIRATLEPEASPLPDAPMHHPEHRSTLMTPLVTTIHRSLAANTSGWTRKVSPVSEIASLDFFENGDGIGEGTNGLIEGPEFRFMRQVLLAALSVVGLLSNLAPSSSPLARTRKPALAPTPLIQDRYCLQGRELGYPGNCEFSTYEQCMATASGTNAYCGVNPQYLFAEQRRGYRPPY